MRYKVLFLVPPLLPIFENDADIRGGRDSYRARYPHMGFAYMTAVLRERGVTYKIVDMNLGYSFDQVVALVKRDNPDFLCTTVYSAGYKKAYSLIDSLRPCFKGKIVVGGPHISVTTKQALQMTLADFAVIGEGETTLLELFQHLKPEAVRGLIWRDDSGIVVNERRPYLKDLDVLPFPAFEDFELEKYLCFTDKRLPIITSRGCPYQCAYCCTRLSMGDRFRARSPENVLAEIRYWYRRGWSKFDINDDVFTLNRDRALKICELILASKLQIQFYLFVGIRADSVDEYLLRKLKMAGCRFISYGCESGNDLVLRSIKKGIQKTDVVRAVNLTRKVGINHKVNFIIGHPTERYEDALDSIRFAKSLRSDFVGFNNLIPYPGTEVYALVENDPNARFLYPPEVYLNDLTHKKLMPVFETDAFSYDKRVKVLRKGFDLEERTLARFRFGAFWGYFAYLLGRNKHIAKLSKNVLNILLSTKIGSEIYRHVFKPPW